MVDELLQPRIEAVDQSRGILRGTDRQRLLCKGNTSPAAGVAPEDRELDGEHAQSAQCQPSSGAGDLRKEGLPLRVNDPKPPLASRLVTTALEAFAKTPPREQPSDGSSRGTLPVRPRRPDRTPHDDNESAPPTACGANQ